VDLIMLFGTIGGGLGGALFLTRLGMRAMFALMPQRHSS
jgi:hypothetical protein